MTKYIDFALIGELVVHGDVHYEDLKRLPAADVQEVRHGHWVYDKGDCFPKCSLCGQYHGTLYEHYYCPVCGAKMEEDEDIPMEYFENGGI